MLLPKKYVIPFCLQAGRRLNFLGHLAAKKLLINEQFSHFCTEFPAEELNETVTAYLTLNKEKYQSFTNYMSFLKFQEL